MSHFPDFTQLAYEAFSFPELPATGTVSPADPPVQTDEQIPVKGLFTAEDLPPVASLDTPVWRPGLMGPTVKLQQRL